MCVHVYMFLAKQHGIMNICIMLGILNNLVVWSDMEDVCILSVSNSTLCCWRGLEICAPGIPGPGTDSAKEQREGAVTWV